MFMHSVSRSLVAVGLAILVWTPAIGAPPATQSPWSKVPPLPTGCYGSGDDFATKIAAARAAVQQDIERQEAVNNELKERYESMQESDPFAEAARIQNLMAENPQKAMEAMQQVKQQTDAAIAGEPLRIIADLGKLHEDLKKLQTQFQAARNKVVTQMDAKFKDLEKRATEKNGGIVVGESGAFYAGWAVKEYNQLATLGNTEVEKACAPWWQPSGPFHGWLKRYRDYLVRDRIPASEKGEKAGFAMSALMSNASASGYKPTATMEGIADYMEQAEKVFGMRPEPRFRKYDGRP